MENLEVQLLRETQNVFGIRRCGGGRRGDSGHAKAAEHSADVGSIKVEISRADDRVRTPAMEPGCGKQDDERRSALRKTIDAAIARRAAA